MNHLKQFYEFEDFRLDLVNKALTRSGGETVPATRKMFETLLVLVENADRLVEKDELMQKIWHGSPGSWPGSGAGDRRRP